MQEQEAPGDVEEPMVQAVSEPAPAAESESSFFDEEMDEGAVAKEALMAETSAGLSGPRPNKAVMGEILLALEARNPTQSPATSPLLNGKWKVLYATGASPGLKALTLLLKGAKQAPKSPSGADLIDVQDAFVTISAEQPRVEASVRTRVLSIENTGRLSSRLEPESAVRLLETYESAESEWPSTLKLPFQSPLQYSRSVLVSYLDDELLVLRDTAGRPDVLMRVEGGAMEPTAVVEESGGATEADNVDDESPGMGS